MRIHPGYHLRELGDDHLVIGKDAAAKKNERRVVRFNASAAFLWRSVEEKEFDAPTLARLLQEEYGLDAVRADADAAAILSAWEDAGLVDA
jgi:hypothetical protein